MGATSASSWPALSICCGGADAGCAAGGGGVCADATCGTANNSATAKSFIVSLIKIASRCSPDLCERFSNLYSFVLYPLSHRLAQCRKCDFRPADDIKIMSSSRHRLRLRKCPFAAHDLRPRSIEAHRIVPARHDRQAVRNFAVATAELDRDRAIVAFLRRDIVERIGVVLVLLVEAGGVVDADRPETVDRHVLDREPIDRLAVVARRRDVEIDRRLVGVATPGRGGCDQMTDRIDLVLGAERVLEVGHCRAKDEKRVAYLLLADRIPVRDFELAGALLADLDRILQGVDLNDILRVNRVDKGAYAHR